VNKRSAPRFPVNLEVMASYSGQSAQPCQVRDYCSGGLYLLCDRAKVEQASARVGGGLVVEFADPLNPRSGVHHLEGRITRFDSHGMGVAITEENAAAIIALSQLAASQAAGGAGVGGSAVAAEQYGQDTVDKTIKAISEKSWEYVAEILRNFFERAKNDLFDAAGQSGSNVSQSAFFGAMNELRKGRDNLSQGFLNTLTEQFDILTTPGFRNRYAQEAAAQGGLSIMESDDLDNWLAVRAMSAKLEERMGETLEALETRFEEISANPITLENNPAGPFVISSIFRDMLGQIVLEDEPRKFLYGVMEKVLSFKLKELYDVLNELLIAHGILPILEKRMEFVREEGDYDEEDDVEDELPPRGAPQKLPRRGNTPAGAPRAAPPPSGRAAGGGFQPPPQQAGGGYQPPQQGGGGYQPQQAPAYGGDAQHQQAGVQPMGAAPQQAYAGQPAPQQGRAASSGPVARAAPTGVNPINYTRPQSMGSTAAAPMPVAQTASAMPSGGGYSHAVQELMRMQGPANEQGVEAPPQGYFSSGQVVQALGQLSQAISSLGGSSMDSMEHVNYLANAVSETVGEAGKGLSATDQEAVTYVGGLFGSISQDHLVAEHARPWFARMEVPLLKAGILDSSLLDDDSHPAREMLNRLESIGDLLDNDESPLAQEAKKRVESVLGKIDERVESDPGIFAEALGELDEVQEKVEENYEEKIKKLIQQCEQEKEIDDARETILNELNKRLGQRDVPVVVLHLLDSGWKNLLLRTLMKSGADSAGFKTYLNVVDMLTARLTGGKPCMDEAKMSDESLVEWSSRMLAMVSTNEKKNNLILRELAKDLTGKSTTMPETKYVQTLIAKNKDRHHAGKPEGVSDDIWQLMLEDARQLEDREAFQFKPKGSKPLNINLVWRDGNKRFVFADNLANSALDIDLEDVSSNIYHKVLVRLNEKDLSVTERAIYSFLQSMHKQIAFQANHDELTGLLNRKAFESELDKQIADARGGKVTHVLGYFDLDRFNIINTTCGHADGDNLLVTVSEVLRDTLKDKAIISRLGGDEFGILVTNTSRTRGLKMLTEVHDNIRGIRFACGNNEFKVTCSMGVTEVNEASESYGHLLSAVDSATFTAKDNGRDNIQIYNIENERISNRRHILDWVGRINVLFEKNLIQFRCQKIAPVHRTINSLPHYEILLDVQDEEGNKVPLEEFIVAAERYNRILDIDTWVMNYIFDWVEERKPKLERVSNLSVNLSGSSLGNPRFMDEVYQRISKPGFPANKICFEVTETAAMNNLEMAARFMKKLKETGCSFALDDFGSGTSSYAYLRSLPIDFVKIDGAFVKDIANNTSDYAVVKSINEIGHVMGMQTVAEGVEDEFAYQLLHDIGVDYVQGFGVEKPIPLFQLFE
jgi:diguanylate cyclase (GGDEF)-like protein